MQAAFNVLNWNQCTCKIRSSIRWHLQMWHCCVQIILPRVVLGSHETGFFFFHCVNTVFRSVNSFVHVARLYFFQRMVYFSKSKWMSLYSLWMFKLEHCFSRIGQNSLQMTLDRTYSFSSLLTTLSAFWPYILTIACYICIKINT